MNTEVQINKLDEADYYYVWLKHQDTLLEGKFETSEIRLIIQTFDNARADHRMF